MELDIRCHLVAVVILSGMCSAFAQCPTVCDCGLYASRKEIRCASRDLTSIPPNIPADTQILRLEHNYILSIGANDLVTFTSLKRLTLYNNEISSIDPSAFQSQGNLELLGLENNKLVSLDSRTFHGMGKLLELNLDNNKLTTFQNGTFQDLVKLTELAISGNPFVVLPDGIFSNLYNVEVLDLSNVNFQMIPGTFFNGLRSMHTLKMNNVTQNGDEVFGNENLFVYVSNLTSLEVRMNSLTCIPTSFSALTKLTSLTLSNNPLTCDDLSVLQVFSALENLHLEYTGINRLTSSMFASNTELLFLSVADSNLAQIEEDAFAGLGQLEELLLFNNNLTTLPNNVFLPIPTHVRMDIADNPFHCDCNLRWLGQWLAAPDTTVDSPPICASPSRLFGQQLRAIDASSFACMPESDATNTTHWVNEGDDVTIECAISGDPAPDLHWLTTDHSELYPGTIQSPFFVSADCTLTITRIQRQDEGTYSCVGSNPSGMVSIRNAVFVKASTGRPTTKATQITTKMTLAPGNSTAVSNPSTGTNMGSYVIIIVGVISLIIVVALLIGMLIFCRRSYRKPNLGDRNEFGMVFQNDPVTAVSRRGICSIPCTEDINQFPYPTDIRYADSIRSPQGHPPPDLPPPYSACSQSTYEQIYDSIGDSVNDNYETPRRPGERVTLPRNPSELDHMYMSQLQRQESQASQGSCGAPAGYERSMLKDTYPRNNLYTSEPATPPISRNQMPGYINTLAPSNATPQEKKAPPMDEGVSLDVKSHDPTATYENTRRK